MKPRTVVVTLEIKTGRQLAVLKSHKFWSRMFGGDTEAAADEEGFVKQVQVNVVGKSDHEKHQQVAQDVAKAAGQIA